MFGISFSELLLVGLVALLVLGPERLPGAARTAGLWIGRLKRSFNAIKQEVERELGADEIRRQLHNEHILQMEQEAKKLMAPLTDLQSQVQDGLNPQSQAQTPPAAPTIAPNSRLNNLPGASTEPAASPETAPTAPAEPTDAPPAPAASQPPASPETPRTP
ncbi:Sec-independent protein translocase protein TatB [Pseudomonas sp. ZM23]|uniref:Sec-independent protein translocase protein TatB n=1 Tax=Pseudomonas triclosanedens TaxID=2961893 RepID=A0ABY6ZZ67_9PSED|nr:Sec-independent protein translocase protein TatB [Pseudomonas triclosanedens]MCP8462962.1 Sec-independent protein translocase protein TatB [Pseudomonas triclosanedens]MCP8468582.1 Sec-independent protein translocase protein TatB [Pseudomonas triclosanedens]MCP8475304.1 Sec-independent protein translocase protein TatB [Pseudomonas triclosanedens]WAI50138.1 Sec-independent protein translocase protein TatB [Pseudomonas triclosanedens]